MNDLSALDKAAMALTLREAAKKLMTGCDLILKVAAALDPPSDLPKHSSASHMS